MLYNGNQERDSHHEEYQMPWILSSRRNGEENLMILYIGDGKALPSPGTYRHLSGIALLQLLDHGLPRQN
jgi:hypothetical protein